ncbi:MAG: efflux RND transporter periplasmic adaptor subunit [Planctomycetes bacterium]|nr:efflux RND transporter periplasmic adaptor subunit [Planctomycetota bacterium]
MAKDQVLARLWIPEMDQQLLQKTAAIDQADAEVAQATAAIAQARAELATANALKLEADAEQLEKQGQLQLRETEHRRLKGLVDRDAVSRELLDEAEYQLAAARAAVKAAEARIKSAQAKEQAAGALIDKAHADRTVAEKRREAARADAEYVRTMMQYATITAPYNGIITRRWVDTGAFVQSAASGKTEPLFTLARVDRLRIVADIPEADAGLVQIGQPVQVSFSRGQPLPGKVVRFADALDSATRNMRTEIELNDAEKFLRPGLFGSVTIALADVPDALLLPANAVLTDAGKPCVLCIEDGQAKQREVELGLNEGGRVQVIRGLSAGSQVIIEGQNLVREGQAVEVIN